MNSIQMISIFISLIVGIIVIATIIRHSSQNDMVEFIETEEHQTQEDGVTNFIAEYREDFIKLMTTTILANYASTVVNNFTMSVHRTSWSDNEISVNIILNATTKVIAEIFWKQRKIKLTYICMCDDDSIIEHRKTIRWHGSVVPEKQLALFAKNCEKIYFEHYDYNKSSVTFFDDLTAIAENLMTVKKDKNEAEAKALNRRYLADFLYNNLYSIYLSKKKRFSKDDLCTTFFSMLAYLLSNNFDDLCESLDLTDNSIDQLVHILYSEDGSNQEAEDNETDEVGE